MCGARCSCWCGGHPWKLGINDFGGLRGDLAEYVTERVDCFHLGIPWGFVGASGLVALEGVSKGLCCMVGIVAGGGVWDRTVVREELQSFGNAFAASGWDVAPMASVVFGGQSEVPSICAIFSPQVLVVRGVVDYYAAPW